MKIILTTLRNIRPHLNFWQFNSIAKFPHWLSLTKVKFHMANLEFFLEVETTRVQIQVLFRAMADETFDMFPTSITISLGSFAVEFWKEWLLVEFENEVFEDLVVVAGLLNMQSLWILQLQSSRLYLILLLPYSLHPLHMYHFRFGLLSSLSSFLIGQE